MDTTIIRLNITGRLIDNFKDVNEPNKIKKALIELIEHRDLRVMTADQNVKSGFYTDRTFESTGIIQKFEIVL